MFVCVFETYIGMTGTHQQTHKGHNDHLEAQVGRHDDC